MDHSMLTSQPLFFSVEIYIFCSVGYAAQSARVSSVNSTWRSQIAVCGQASTPGVDGRRTCRVEVICGLELYRQDLLVEDHAKKYKIDKSF